ncbi:AAA family ATPase [Myxococcota bacterium]|nr:AAA family ATPase [Myxococcota bacterium]
MLPAIERLPEARPLIEAGGYFVLHAPRQTGKTTTLRALATELTSAGALAALYVTCEAAEVAGDDYEAAQLGILENIRIRAELDLPPELRPPDPWPSASPVSLLQVSLAAWASRCPRPLVLFFDEIDALRGGALIAVLRQLRAGYPDRPRGYPWSVVLCGLRDVRDYKVAAGGDAERLGTSSPFNVKVESLRLADFSRDDVRRLYAQHTSETGQAFTPEASECAFELTGGQPWLVNAIAREIVEKLRVPLSDPITADHVDRAKERLILARQTHLDSLVARLLEPRVRKVVEPLMAGATLGGDSYDDDVSYVRDLGLVAPDAPVRIANPIYREVVARVLSSAAQDQVDVEPRGFVSHDGRLDIHKIIEEFATFWRENGEVLAGKMPYHEVAPQLVMMAFLQRVVNGGGHVDREYGVGRGRIDLLVRWPHVDGDGRRVWQREAIELKVWAEGRRDPIDAGLQQLESYLSALGLDRGVLVLFDRRPSAAPVGERTVLTRAVTSKGYEVTVLRA